MIFKFLNFVAAIAIFVVCFQATEAGPAYPGSTFNSWDNQQAAPQQQRRTAPAQRNTLQTVVRQQIGDLDKQTQSDLKVLGYLEKELNKIFSCYIKLSCPRMRSPKVMSECEEIKDWPLYHQVMKMAGIRKYPYQSYAPSSSSHRFAATTELPEMNFDEDTTSADDIIIDNGEDIFSNNQNFQDDDYSSQRSNRQRSNRRVRRGSKHQHHHHQHHLNGAPVTSDDGQ